MVGRFFSSLQGFQVFCLVFLVFWGVSLHVEGFWDLGLGNRPQNPIETPP